MHHSRNLTKTLLRNLDGISQFIHSLKHSDVYLLILSCVLIVIIKYVQFPSLTYRAEMFAENGTNFFINAFRYDLLTNLFATDAGYLPLLQRIISLVLVKGFHVIEWYPHATQGVAVVFIAAMSSLFNLRFFSKFCRSALIRFILGITIALVPDYEIHAFINFVYFGALLLFLGIFIKKETLSNLSLASLTALCVLIILSKGYFIVFIPIYFFLLYRHFQKKEHRSWMFYFTLIVAIVIQLIVMLTNASKAATDRNLLYIPLYFIKTIYYFVLTYKHVFIGFVTKEYASLLGIGILSVLLVIGVKKIIRKNDKPLLYFIFVGNFIAICSLFFTISFSNNNVDPLIKIISLINKTLPINSTSTAPQEVRRSVLAVEKDVQGIYDVKHFANLRSLFIPNALIFITGSIILINLFNKKSHGAIVALILFLTSGAFGQIKVEELYPTKYQSYSQWRSYYPLLEKDQFCIPINAYWELLKQNCDYLIFKSAGTPLRYSERMESVTLSEMAPTTETWEVQAVILINQMDQLSDSPLLNILAYNKENELIGRAKQIIPSNYEYVYYLFQNPVSDIETLRWKTVNNKQAAVIPNIIVLGMDKAVPGRKLEY